MKSSAMFAIVAATTLVGVLAGTAVMVMQSPPSDKFSQCRGGAVGGGDIGGPFTLMDENAKTVTDVDIITKPTLVYFGYTFCPDICPMDSARNAEAIDFLAANGMDVTPVFITIDPERDTPEVLRDYTDNLHSKMIGLTGTADQIKAASQAYKTYYKKQEGDPNYYLMDHSTFTYLMLPQTGFADFFDRDATPADIAERTACFINAAQ